MNNAINWGKVILVTFVLAIGGGVGYGAYQNLTRAKSAPTPTPTIDPAIRARLDKELSPDAIFKALEIKEKLRDRDAFLQECRTQSREELIETINQLTLLVGDCEAALDDARHDQ